MALTQTFIYTKRGSVACPISITAPDSYGTTKLVLTIELGTSTYRGRLSSEAVLVPGQNPELGGEAGVYWGDLGRFVVIGTATEINLVLSTLVYHADANGAELPTIPAPVTLTNFVGGTTRATGVMTLQPKADPFKVSTLPIYWMTPITPAQRFQKYTVNASSKSFDIPAFTKGSVVSYVEKWTPKAVSGRHQYLSVDTTALATLPSASFTLVVDYHGTIGGTTVSKSDGASGILSKIATAISINAHLHGVVATSFTDSNNKPFLRIERYDTFEGVRTNLLNFTTDPADVVLIKRQDAGSLAFLKQETGQELFIHGELVHGTILNADLERAAGRWAIDSETGALAWKCYAVRPALNAYHDTVRFRPATDYNKTGRFELLVTDRYDGTLRENINFYTQDYTLINGNQSFEVVEGTTTVPVLPMHIVGPEFSDLTYTVRFTMSKVTDAVISSTGTGSWHPPVDATPGYYEATNTLRNINKVMRTFAIKIAAVNPASFSVILTINNDLGQSMTREIKVKTILPPTAPTMNNANITHLWTEDAVYSFAPAPSISDVNADDVLTVTATLSTSIGALSSTGGGTWDAATDKWTVSGSEVEVNAALAALKFTPNANADTNFVISIEFSDQTARGGSSTLTMNCNAVADKSTFTAPTTLNYRPDFLNNIIGEQITLSDPDTADACSLTISTSVADVGTFSGLPMSVSNGVYTYSGTPVALSALIGGLNFTPKNSGTTDTLNDDHTIAWTEDTNKAITPAISLTTGTYFNQTFNIILQYSDNTGIVQTKTISAVPIGYTPGTVTAKLSIPSAAGSLSTSNSYQTATATTTVVGANRIRTITGQVAHVNTILSSVTFVPAANYDLTFNITVETPARTSSIIMTCTPINDAPTATNLNATYTYDPRIPFSFPAIVVTDPDTGDTITAIYNAVGTGCGSLAPTGETAFEYYSKTGSRTEVNAALAAMKYIPAQPTEPFGATNLNYTGSYTEDTPFNLPAIYITNDDPFRQSFSINVFVSDLSSSTVGGVINMNPLAYTNTVYAEFTFPAARGTLGTTTALPDGVTRTDSTSGGNSIVRFTGSPMLVNSALETLRFTPIFDSFANFTMGVTVSNTVSTSTGTHTYNGIAANQPHTIQNGGVEQIYNPTGVHTITPALVVADADNRNTYTVTATMSKSFAGKIGDAAPGAVWTFTGNKAQVNAKLAALTFTADEIMAVSSLTNSYAYSATAPFTPGNPPIQYANHEYFNEAFTLTVVVTDEDGLSATTNIPFSSTYVNATPNLYDLRISIGWNNSQYGAYQPTSFSPDVPNGTGAIPPVGLITVYPGVKMTKNHPKTGGAGNVGYIGHPRDLNKFFKDPTFQIVGLGDYSVNVSRQSDTFVPSIATGTLSIHG
jgi:hypothetical protein